MNFLARTRRWDAGGCSARPSSPASFGQAICSGERYLDGSLAQRPIAAGVRRRIRDRVDAPAACAAALVPELELAVVGAEGRPLDVLGEVAVTEAVVGLVARDRDEPDGRGGVAGIGGDDRRRDGDGLGIRGPEQR